MLHDQINVGVSVGHTLLGLVPEYHVISAATKYGYTYHGTWQGLTWQQQAQLVAHFFAQRLIDTHTQDAINYEMQKRAKRNAARSQRGGRGR